MSKVYKVHKWLSIISLIFFLMFCITGLLLMFRTELNAWAQGGTTHHSSAIMSMNEHEESIFKYADQGALLVKQKYPSKDILNIICDIHYITNYMERAKGIEPSSQAWEARILPMNYARTM